MAFRRLGRRVLLLLATLAIFASAGYWAFRHVGRWLVRPDDLQHARAIVVLSGKIPYRAMEAAKLYHEGWASEVWLLRDQPDDSDTMFIRLRIVHPSDQDYDEQILERMGVPKESIRVLEPPTTNTVSEIYRIVDELRKQDADRVILVTSPLHTRRSKLIWRHVAGNHPEVIMRLGSDEPTDPDHWWRSTEDIQDVTHEILGLIDARLGFIAKPR